MKSHGLLMSDPMMRAVLSGQKTVTRRLSGKWANVNPGDEVWMREVWHYWDWTEDGYPFIKYRCDGAERCIDVIDSEADSERFMRHWIELSGRGIPARDTVWRSSMIMPRTVCRSFGEVVSVREERLQDITEDDCRLEGMHTVTWGDVLALPGKKSALRTLSRLWESLSMRERFALYIDLMNPGSWTANPPVYRVEWS